MLTWSCNIEIDFPFIVVALSTTAFRLVTRKRVRWGWDDLFAVLAASSMVLQGVALGGRLLYLANRPGSPHV